MDCERCGRHRPSHEITPSPAAGRLVMTCARCRGIADGLLVVGASAAFGDLDPFGERIGTMDPDPAGTLEGAWVDEPELLPVA